MRPYRLINATELHDLQQQFTQVIAHWNEEYCVRPLTISLTLPQKQYTASDTQLIHAHDKPIAWVERTYLNTMKHALFGSLSPCFNAVSHKLSLILLQRLFKTQQCQITHSIQEQSEWFYSGSSCVLVTLSTDQESGPCMYCTLILSPDWVYQQLPRKTSHGKTLHALDDALEEHTLQFHVALNSSTLSLANISTLQVGDVLSTDHLLTMPLRLSCGKHLVAQVDLRQSSQHKSIIIKRFL